MASSRGNPEIENPGNSGPDNPIAEVLKLLVQENQTLKAQMAEVLSILQVLKNAIITENNAAVSTEAAVTLPPPGPGVNHLAHIPRDTAQCEGSHPQGHQFENSQPKDRYHLLEERLRAIEGSNTRAKDAYDLCLVPDVVVPPKFKVPDFDKYKGTTCPNSHLTMYCRKMAAYAHDDKVLIHYFQDSLAGASLNWYMQLQPSDIHSWKDLSEAFSKQYQYNLDMAPDRTQLQNMGKRGDESFKEYAQRWRSQAAQVTPSLTEKEMVYVFMETLPTLYYDRLVGSVSSNFSDMVTIGERIETGIRRGKISCNPAGTSNANGFPTKKNGEANAIMNQRKSSKFDSIPMTYADLCSHLVSRNVISPRSMKPIQPPFPRGYQPKAICEFHAGAIGHSTENCKPFKYIVQGLIDTKQLVFKEDGKELMINLDPQNSAVIRLE